MKISVEVPFSGYYESIPDSMIDDAILGLYDYDYRTDDSREVTVTESNIIWMSDINYTAIREEFNKKYIDAINKEFDLDLEYTEMVSPKFYNFSTDRIFATMPKDQFNKIRREVEKYPEYPGYIKDHYTSYDGFSSNYSYDVTDEDWTRDELDDPQTGSILKLYFKNNGGDDWYINMYYEIAVNEFDTIQDADEVIRANFKKRLEELRSALESESISTSELLELQDLAPYIEDSDVQLLEPAGVPEFNDKQEKLL